MCRGRVDSGRMGGISVGEYAEFFQGGREVAAMVGYGGAFKEVEARAGEIGVTVFRWGRGSW